MSKSKVKNKSCGGCIYFFKIKLNNFGGICQFFDAGTKTDHGRNCSKFKHKKIHKQLISDNEV